MCNYAKPFPSSLPPDLIYPPETDITTSFTGEYVKG